jgi:L-fuconolactonase
MTELDDPAVPTHSNTRPARIDAHHHLWRYTAEEFGWITDDMAVLRHDFLVLHLEHVLAGAHVDAAITVQARCTLDETSWLLMCSDLSKRIAGVVGWAPLDSRDVRESLERFSQHAKFVGVREIAQGKPAGFLERRAFQRGIKELTRLNLTYDILIYSDQLEEAIRFVDRHPRQRFVLDHAAKPPIKAGELEPWATHLHELARRENVACKLSGLTTEADWTHWSLETLRPYLDVCVEAFGTSRLLAGSDWPVCLVATSYTRWWQTLSGYFHDFSDPEQGRVFGGNAAATYGLTTSLPTSSEVLS